MPKQRKLTREERRATLNAFILTADDMAIEWGDQLLARQGLEAKERESNTATRSPQQGSGATGKVPFVPGPPTPSIRGSFRDDRAK